MPKVTQKSHQWISFLDPEDNGKTWLFDVSFMLSNWSCIFGNGCKGVYPEDATKKAEGCCSLGAHMVDKKETKRITKLAKKLSASEWQYRSLGLKKGVIVKTRSGEDKTRLIDGACIFLNRSNFDGPKGCAFHIHAQNNNILPLKVKPTVCWQLPIRMEELTDTNKHVYVTIRAWERRDWGDGGSYFYWWCTETAEAFIGKDPVYKSLKPELIELCGTKVYHLLEKHLNEIASNGYVPYPISRRRLQLKASQGKN